MKLIQLIETAAIDLQTIGHDIVIGLHKLRLFDDEASKAITPIVQMATPFVPQARTALSVVAAQQALIDAIDDWASAPGIEMPANISQKLQALRDAASQHSGVNAQGAVPS